MKDLRNKAFITRAVHAGERIPLGKYMPAATLGDIYTLVLHPATSSHRSLSAEERAQVGIREGLVRISVGIEDANDIIADLEQALAALP